MREHLGATPLRRVGRDPKLMLVYRAATEPLSKASTRLFRNDAGLEARVEVLGKGCQFAAHGMHPCGKPYTWGEASPDDTTLDELPAVTAEQVAAVIEDIEALFLEHGYHPVTEERTARPSDHTEPRPGSDILPPGDLEAFATKIGNPDLGWDEWNNAGMAFWRASGGSEAGRAAFHTWSQQSGKYDHDTTAARWERYEKSPPTQLGVGTLVYLAQQAQPDFRRPSLGPDPREDTQWQKAHPHAAGRTAKAKPNGADGEAHRWERDSSEAEPAAPSAPRLDITHDGLALDMGRTWADARHVALWGHWLFWAGSCWERDACLLHLTRCREYLRQKGDDLVRWAKAKKGEKLVEKCEAIAKQLRSAQMVANVVGLARSNPEQAANVDQWDSDPFELGAPKTARTPP